MEIVEDSLTGSRIAALLEEHLEEMHSITPPESVHALDLESLRAPEITFWSAWEGEELLGCGALQELDPKSGEIKSMRTVAAHRRRGVGARILDHILEVARGRGYEWLFLETGSMAEFEPARALYSRYGFELCPPFGSYVEDPNSVFMCRRLAREAREDREA